MSGQRPTHLLAICGIVIAGLTLLLGLIVALEDGQLGAFGSRISGLFAAGPDPVPAPPPLPRHDPAPASGAPRVAEVLRGGTLSVCGQDFSVSFLASGSGLGDGVILRGGDNAVTLRQHESMDVPPACALRFERFIERSQDYAEFTVTE